MPSAEDLIIEAFRFHRNYIRNGREFYLRFSNKKGRRGRHQYSMNMIQSCWVAHIICNIILVVYLSICNFNFFKLVPYYLKKKSKLCVEKIIVTVSRNFKIISSIIFNPVFLYIPVQYKLYKINYIFIKHKLQVLAKKNKIKSQ